jgi:hypothetical protein
MAMLRKTTVLPTETKVQLHCGQLLTYLRILAKGSVLLYKIFPFLVHFNEFDVTIFPDVTSSSSA